MIENLFLSEEKKIILTYCIRKSLCDDFPDMRNENNLETNNGGGLYRWNFVNKNAKEIFESDFQVEMARRGSWYFVIIYDGLSKFTFTFMTEQNYKSLQKRTGVRKHYIDALTIKNPNSNIDDTQIKFDIPNNIERNIDDLTKLREQLLLNFSGIIQNHVLILFNCQNDKIISIRAILPTPTLEIAYTEDWSTYIGKSYIRNSLVVNIDDNDNYNGLLSIKSHIIENIPNEKIILKEKKEKKSNNEA